MSAQSALNWFLQVDEVCDKMRRKALEAIDEYSEENPSQDKLKGIKDVMIIHLDSLRNIWKDDLKGSRINDLGRHIYFGMMGDYDDIVNQDLPDVEGKAREFAKAHAREPENVAFEKLLHPMIVSASMGHFRDGDYRDAVLNGVIAIFDSIRQKSGLQDDGPNLIDRAFAPRNPLLVFSEMESDSGKNDQSGFMQILKGVYQGVRNPKAHTLVHDLDARKAGQYLVMLSLLARRVEEAKRHFVA